MSLLDQELIPDSDRYTSVAPMAKRIANGIVDLLAVGLLTYLSLWIALQLNENILFFARKSYTLPLLYLGVQWLYYFIGEASNGSTLGKRLSGTTVRAANGNKASTSALVLRTTLRLIPIYPLLFLFGLRWHDRLAHCEVFENHAK